MGSSDLTSASPSSQDPPCQDQEEAFPGSPMARTLGCHYRGTGLTPGQGIKIPQARDTVQPKNPKRTRGVWGPPSRGPPLYC